MADTGSGTSDGVCDERYAAVRQVLADNLDSAIKTESGKYGFTYKDAVTPFSGHDVCSSTAWLWGDYNPYGGTYIFHPNATGQSSGYAQIVLGSI